MESDKELPSAGRRISRRGRSGFGFSNSGLSDATATEGGNINDRVERMATAPAAIPAPQPPATDSPTGSQQEEFNPRGRMAQVRGRASEYEREYRLGLLHRLIMRRVPMDEIADQLGLSISQVYRDREELKERLRKEAQTLDIEEMIGDSKGFYEEAAAMAMRAASSSNVPMPIRLAAVRTALASKNDMHRFFQTAGVYDVLRFRIAQDGSGVSDVRRLMDATERLLAGEPEFSTPHNTGDDEEIDL